MRLRVDRLVLDGRGDVAEQQAGLHCTERDVGALAVGMRGGGLAVEPIEAVLGGAGRGAALQQREEVPPAVPAIDHGLSRLGDVVVGPLARQAHVGDHLAAVGDADRGPERAAPQSLGHLGGVVDPGRVVRVAVAASHEAGEAFGTLGGQEVDLDARFVGRFGSPVLVHECHTSARWCSGCTVVPQITQL